eukprot:TRINITY_DN1398_c0_g1_i2.p1 TRINITY_DN1398_c0_g1~~TRINITY_DN1398_c0_g1_i2.p1  ORF type:complete len:351 (+),score=61.86 TRINITY_DN1398_c0_g1_i2:43-1095(+)
MLSFLRACKDVGRSAFLLSTTAISHSLHHPRLQSRHTHLQSCHHNFQWKHLHVQSKHHNLQSKHHATLLTAHHIPRTLIHRMFSSASVPLQALPTDHPIDVVLPPADYPIAPPRRVNRKVAPLIVRRLTPGKLVVQRGAICRVTKVHDLSRGEHRDVEVFFENPETGHTYSEVIKATKLLAEPHVDRVRYRFESRDRYGAFLFSKVQLRKPGDESIVASAFAIGDAATYLVPSGEYYLLLNERRVVGIDLPRIIECVVLSVEERPTMNSTQTKRFARLQCGVEVQVPSDIRPGFVIQVDRFKNSHISEQQLAKPPPKPPKAKMTPEEKEIRQKKLVRQHANISMLKSLKV